MGQQASAPPAHSAASPATAGGGGGVAVTPAWSRPDDASRQAQLDAMKRRAAGPPAPAPRGVATPRLFQAQYPPLRWVAGTAQASLVGGPARRRRAGARAPGGERPAPRHTSGAGARQDPGGGARRQPPGGAAEGGRAVRRRGRPRQPRADPGAGTDGEPLVGAGRGG